MDVSGVYGEEVGNTYGVDRAENASEKGYGETEGDTFQGVSDCLCDFLAFAGWFAVVGVDMDELAHSCCFHKSNFQSPWTEVFGVSGIVVSGLRERKVG
jgi:hypothetical protein